MATIKKATKKVVNDVKQPKMSAEEMLGKLDNLSDAAVSAANKLYDVAYEAGSNDTFNDMKAKIAPTLLAVAEHLEGIDEEMESSQVESYLEGLDDGYEAGKVEGRKSERNYYTSCWIIIGTLWLTLLIVCSLLS